MATFVAPLLAPQHGAVRAHPATAPLRRSRAVRRPRHGAGTLIARLPGLPGPPAAAGVLASRAKEAIERRLLLGNRLTAELAAIMSVYFVQGVLVLPRLALSFFLKDELLLTPAAVAQLTALATLPWVVKPLYGFLTDSVPIGSSRRRAYLVLSGAMGATSWLALSSVVHDEPTALLAALFAAASVAISDVVADSLVVERVRAAKDNSTAGALQTLCWGTSAFGGLVASGASGALLAALGTRKVFALTAMLPAAVAALALVVNEEPVRVKRGPAGIARAAAVRARALWRALTARQVLLPIAFVFAWQSTPNAESALFFFQTNELGFGPEFLGIVRFVSSAAALGGLYCYRAFWRDLPVKKLMGAAALASVPLSLTQLILVTRLNVSLGISDRIFALSDTAVLTALGQVAFMPTLVLAARLCPPGIEGTLFAALMSIYNGSGAVSGELGAILTHLLGVTETDFTNLGWLVTICSLSNLLALPLLDLLDNAPESVEACSTSGAEDDESVLTATALDEGVKS